MVELAKGMRVRVPQGVGTVAYVRRRPPDFGEIEACSVLLDHKRHLAGYTGTTVAAKDVRAIPPLEGVPYGAQRVAAYLAKRPTGHLVSVHDICSRTNREPTEVLEDFEPLLSRGFIAVTWARDEEQSKAAITRKGREAVEAYG